MKNSKPLTRQEAAERTGLSIRTIDRLIAGGALPAHKFARAVRIDREAFERYLDGHRKMSTAYVGTRMAI